jgi:hypothetical protein
MNNFNEQDLVVDRLSDYETKNIKVIDKWDDRSGTPCQSGCNNATVELSNGTRVKVGYMYEDRMWMPY